MKIAFDPYMIRHLSLTTLLPMYRRASPFEDERQWSIKCWKKAIEVSVEMGCETMISEFGRGASPERSGGEKPGANTKEMYEAGWWRSMEEQLPIFEREGITLSVTPHPEASSRFMRREILRYVAKYWK